MDTPKETPIKDLTIHFSEEPYNDSIVVAIPCGCEVEIMSRARGGVCGDNEPSQFKSHCNAHYW